MRRSFAAAWAKFQSFNLNVLAEQNGSLFRGLAIVVLIVQIIACLIVVHTNLMLQGDGSYFVYVLSLGEAWAYKWADIPARFSVYALTVAPSQWLTHAFSLTPLQATAVNGFFFYSLPIAQFAVVAAMMWRNHAQYLVFPIAQYCLATLFGFGFPSEILLAPGFLWICAALLLQGRGASVWFAVCLTGLLLSHELALPAAAIMSWIAVAKADPIASTVSSRFRTMIFVVIAFGLFFGIRILGGGAGSDSNAIYVFDPRRVLNNPSFFLSAVISGAVFSWLLFRNIKPTVWHYLSIFGMAFFLPLCLGALSLDIDFEQGRYDSARTIIGASMFVLSLAFLSTIDERTAAEPAHPDVVSMLFPSFIVAMLAVGSGSAMQFAYDWSQALNAVSEIVADVRNTGAQFYIIHRDARLLMQPRQAVLSEQMDFGWVLPYRSLVIANGKMPHHIIYDEVSLDDFCLKSRSIKPRESSRIPISIHENLAEFACSYQAPPRPPGLKDKFVDMIRRFISTL